MTNINIIENKLASIKRYLVLLKTYQKYTLESVLKDVTLRGAIERYLYLAVQASLELAEAFISFRELRKPTVYSESFEIIYETGIISQDLMERLVRMAEFRNVISHDYEKIDFERVYDVLQNRLGNIGEFVEAIKEKL